MKERILTNWTFTRSLFLVMGLVLMVQSTLSHQWFGVVLGGYFAVMGLFAFGCAAGNCFGGQCEVKPNQPSKTDIPDVVFEEVKAR